ncbi:MAG: segregation/condensation protein A, partial [Lewinella sp.]|nr:segregation/condensation protein A [Lewinella sp.]
TIEDQQQYIFQQLDFNKRASFSNVFNACKNRIHAIVTFLALLELLNMGKITITVGEGVNNFWIEPGNEFEEEE